MFGWRNRRGRASETPPQEPGAPRQDDVGSINAFAAPRQDGEPYHIVIRQGSALAQAHAAYEQYRVSGDGESLSEAAQAVTAALTSTSDAPLILAHVHGLRCLILVQAYRNGADAAQLDEAITSGREALRLAGTRDPYYPENLGRLTEALVCRTEARRDPDAVKEAERLLRDAAATWPDAHPEVHANLSQILVSREIALDSNPAALDEAVRAAETALRLSVPGDEAFGYRQMILGRALMIRSTRGADTLGDMDRALALFRAAQSAAEPGGSRHAMLAGFIQTAEDGRRTMATLLNEQPPGTSLGSMLGKAPLAPPAATAGRFAPPPQLIIDLAGDGAAGDGGTIAGTVTVSSSEDGPVSEPRILAWPLDADALEDLRWYLENYLDAPYGVYEDRGAATAASLDRWGHAVFDAILGAPASLAAYSRMRHRGDVELVFRSASPALLGLPWELILDSSRPRPLALDITGVSRALPGPRTDGQSAASPGQRLRVLMIISRPAGQADVGYRMIARVLLERLAPVRGTVDLVVLRPPTLDALRAQLAAAAVEGRPYQVVHFDGHGVFTRRAATGGDGALVFERPGGGRAEVPAAELARVLAEAEVPVVVLNACQSGAVGKDLEAAVATRLLAEGVASVVAMAYTVHTVAAAEFMAAFYEALFAGATVSAAVTAGRLQMFDHPGRPSPKGRLPLADWLVPVHYRRHDIRFPQAVTARPPGSPSLTAALADLTTAAGERTVQPDGADVAEASDLAPADGSFIGRDGFFYAVEQAADRSRVVILTGQAGTGKTELAKAIGRWWQETGGVDGPQWVLWHSFEQGSWTVGLDSVIDAIGTQTDSPEFALLDRPARRAAVLRDLATHRALLIWDNFESVRSIPDPLRAAPPLDEAACAELRDFLADVAAGGSTTVLITSRAAEEWLGEYQRVTVGGLARHEANEYADVLLAGLPAAAPRRAERDFADLMQWLDGNPLCMRLVLPRLAAAEPGAILARLRQGAPYARGDAEPGDVELWSSIAHSFFATSPRAQRWLPILSLFSGHVGYLMLATTAMFPGMPERFAGQFEDWRAVLDEAVNVGLLSEDTALRYRLHPALPAFLAAVWRAGNPGGFEAERDATLGALTAMWAGFFAQLNKGMGDDPAQEQKVIGHDQPTVSVMLRYALDHAQWREAGHLYLALDRHWKYRGLTAEAGALAEQVRTAIEATEGTAPAPGSPADALYQVVSIRTGRFDSRGGTAEAGQDGGDGAGQAGAVRARRRALVDNVSRFDPALREFWEAAEEAEAAQHEGRWGDAERWARAALALAETSGLDMLRLMAIGSLAKFLTNRGQGNDLGEAIGLFEKALEIRQEQPDTLEIARGHYDVAVAAYNADDLGKAERHARESHALNQRGQYRQGLEGDYQLLGSIARRRGQLTVAEEWHRRALVVSGDLGHARAAASTCAELALTACDARDFEEAAQWARKALSAYTELGDRRGMATVYARLALIDSERQRVGWSLMWVILGLALFGDPADPAVAAERIYLGKHVDLQGIESLEDCWREVTGKPLPAPVRSHFAAHSAIPENRDAAEALRREIEASVGLPALREFTLREVRDAVREYRAE